MGKSEGILFLGLALVLVGIFSVVLPGKMREYGLRFPPRWEVLKRWPFGYYWVLEHERENLRDIRLSGALAILVGGFLVYFGLRGR